MPDAFSRERMLLGEAAVQRLRESHVIVFGLGGVGSFAVEALARAGVGELTLVDHDTISITNLNRQLYALHSTLGRRKVDVARERVRDINPDCNVHVIPEFYLPEHAQRFWGVRYSYIVDAIDTVSAKIDLACRAQEMGIPIIASMGTGNKLDPSRFEVADLYETQVCPLCRVMRRELKKGAYKRCGWFIPGRSLCRPRPAVRRGKSARCLAASLLCRLPRAFCSPGRSYGRFAKSKPFSIRWYIEKAAGYNNPGGTFSAGRSAQRKPGSPGEKECFL